jgi:chromosome segregation ATPase
MHEIYWNKQLILKTKNYNMERMMLKLICKVTLLFMCTVFLFGCATTDDPREGGYFDALHAMATGRYDQRIRDKQTELYARNSIHADLKNQKDKLDAEKAQIDAELIANQESLASLQLELEAFDKKLRMARTQGKIQKKSYNTLRQQVASLSKQANTHANENGDLTGKRIHIEELKKRKQQLEDSMQKAFNKLR